MFSQNEIKQNLALSYITEAGDALATFSPKGVYKAIQYSLYRSKQVSNKFEVVWGVILSEKSIIENKNNHPGDHVLFLVKNSISENDYRLAIRGTTTKINLLEDIDIIHALWNNIDTQAPADSKITKGIELAIKTILIAKNNLIPHIKLTLLEFLDNLITHQKNLINLTVTGHSLGGALASTLAVYLKQYYLAKAAINLNIHCCSFAAPGIGNKTFTDYCEKIFNISGNNTDIYISNFIRVYNSNDIVPKAWNRETLKELPDIYPATEFPKINAFALTILLKLLDLFPPEDQYQQPSPSEEFSSALYPGLQWDEQVYYQHLNAYPINYAMSWKKIANQHSPGEGDIIVILR